MQSRPQCRIKAAIDKSCDQHLQTDIAHGALDNQCAMGKQRCSFDCGVTPAAPVASFHFRYQIARHVPRRDITVRQRNSFARVARALLGEQIGDLIAQQLHAGQTFQRDEICTAINIAQSVDNFLLCLRHVGQRDRLQPIFAGSCVGEKQGTWFCIWCRLQTHSNLLATPSRFALWLSWHLPAFRPTKWPDDRQFITNARCTAATHC